MNMIRTLEMDRLTWLSVIVCGPRRSIVTLFLHILCVLSFPLVLSLSLS